MSSNASNRPSPTGALRLKAILAGIGLALKAAARLKPVIRDAMKLHDCVVEIRLKNRTVGRHYVFSGGRLRSCSGFHRKPDVVMEFNDLAAALSVLSLKQDRAKLIHLAKNFRMTVDGDDKLSVWFMQLMNALSASRWKYGTPQKDGSVRYTTCTNGGPLFVYVKDGRILRTTPIDFSNDDTDTWTIRARGREFSPKRTAIPSSYAFATKSTVYSENRALYPMKRVDFDPKGDRNTQNRGKSGYVRISWDEALDIVSSEIKRMKKEHGPGAIYFTNIAHNQWGNLNYLFSAAQRFSNLIGVTRMVITPISWEGWYWGAEHHAGNAARVGLPGSYGTVEDLLKEAELIVFWSSDPESTSGVYAGGEGTQRRLWAKELGIEFVHIDPHYNPTAQLLGGKWIPIKPGTDPALAMAIMHEWIVNEQYDQQYVTENTTGFDEWRDYILGVTDGVPKTPEWQEHETGVPAKDVRSLATLWARKKTYLGAGGLGAGFGGAGRTANGARWTSCMVLMMAMQGWGKPGVNFGNLQAGTPLDMSFYFPGYADGGISGDLVNTASAINNYVRMPHMLTMNPVKQVILNKNFPDAVLKGKDSAVYWSGMTTEEQFSTRYEYPAPAHSPIRMVYRIGGSWMSTMQESGRYAQAYRDPSIEIVVSQSVWQEGDTNFADIILPACTSLERWDIGESANCAGYIHHSMNVLNHRIITMQHKCIEPLGESKSDYLIFQEILERLGLGALYTEGCTDLDWCKRIFDSTDLPEVISWEEFLKKGYYVVPPGEEKTRDPVSLRWFAEGRKKDVPEPFPLPSQYNDEYRKGLETQSGKIEFVSNSLLRASRDGIGKPALNYYEPPWEGSTDDPNRNRFPLQMITSHSVYSFHTHLDGKQSAVNDVPYHRVKVDGYYYWIIRMNIKDANDRGIRKNDLVKVYNDRGTVLVAADVCPAVAQGTVKSYQSSAVYDIVETSDGAMDRGGCVNMLTSERGLEKGTRGIAPNSCLVQIEKFSGEILARETA